MGKKKNKMGLVLVLFLVIAVSMILTALIVIKMVTKKATGNKSAYRVENAYVVNSSGGKIKFFFDGIMYEFDGELEESYEGIADITVNGNKITKLSIKGDYITGILDAYSKDTITVSELGELERKNEIPVYSVAGEEIKTMAMSELIVGTSRLKYVFEKGKVCAIVVEQSPEIQTIRVLLKNKTQLYYKKLYISSDHAWKLGGQKWKANEVCNVNAELKRTEATNLKATVTKGKLYLCDKKGKQIGNKYEGTFYLKKQKEGIVVVNELPMEDYVRYVLPSEMPPSFSQEALKAQAICARTFAYKHMEGENYAEFGANLDDSTSYQVYNASQPTEETDAAVKQTKGKVLTYGEDFIDCYYYSTSPGVTENLEIWGEKKSPAYLQAVRTLSNQTKYKDLSKENTFHSFITKEPKSNDSSSPYYRWTAKIDKTGLGDDTLGDFQSMKVLRRSKSGYVLSVSCQFEKGKKTLKNEFEIRNYLGKALDEVVLKDKTSRKGTLLPSACFEIAKQGDDVIVLNGGGFGHGVGMSQYGANELGKEGKKCQEILAVYYPNSEIRDVGRQ